MTCALADAGKGDASHPSDAAPREDAESQIDAQPQGDAAPEDAERDVGPDAGAEDAAPRDAEPGPDWDPGPALAADGCPVGMCFDASGWCWDTPRPQGEGLADVWATSGQIFATTFRGTILRYGGVGWTIFDPWARPRTPAAFHVSGRSLTDWWVIGSSTAAHFNGRNFTPQTDPGPITDFWAAPSGLLWLVFDDAPFLARFDGRIVVPATLTTDVRRVTSIWGTADDDVYATAGLSTGERAVLHYDGSSWTESFRGPAAGPSGALLRGWSRHRTDVWAVGDRVVLRRDETGWHDVQIPSSVYAGVSGFGVDEIWLLGATGLQHGFGETFTPLLAPVGHMYTDAFVSAPDRALFTGPSGTIGTWDGQQVQPYSCGPPISVDGLKVFSSTSAFAFGLGPGLVPLVLKKEGTLWRSLQVQLPAGQGFEHALGSGPDDLYFVGNGAVSHYTTASGFSGDGAPSGRWHDGAFASPEELWIVGDETEFMTALARKFRGSWTALTQFRWGESFYAVYAGAPNDVWMVGSGGIVVGYNRSQFTSTPIPGAGSLRAIESDRAGRLLVGGDGGLYRITPTGPGSGRFATEILTDVPAGVRSILAFGPDDIWVIGDFGLGHHDGSQFSITPGHDLPFIPYAIDGTGANDLLLGGDSGVLRRSP